MREESEAAGGEEREREREGERREELGIFIDFGDRNDRHRSGTWLRRVFCIHRRNSSVHACLFQRRSMCRSSLSLSLAYRLLLLLRPLNSLAGYLRCDREKGSQSERDRESGK